jgi:hypothetical protein
LGYQGEELFEQKGRFKIDTRQFSSVRPSYGIARVVVVISQFPRSTVGTGITITPAIIMMAGLRERRNIQNDNRDGFTTEVALQHVSMKTSQGKTPALSCL